MTRPPIVIATMFGLLSLASAARAAPEASANDETSADVRCVVVAFGLVQSPDPQVKALATGASLYFVGRIRGRSPDLDLEAAIINQVGTMAPEDLRDELQRCSGVLQAEGGKLQQVGADLKKLGAASTAATSPPK
jgi:hypothetical protein